MTLALVAGASAAGARTMGPAEVAALVSPRLGTALAARGLDLVRLDARGASWDLPEDAEVAELRLGEGAVNLAALDVTVSLTAAGRDLGTRALRLSAVAEAPLLVAAAPLRPGDRLEGRTEVQRQRLDGPTVSYLLPAPAGEELERLVARRALSAGTAVRTADVRRERDVSAGQAVSAEVMSGHLRLESSATALGAGDRGDAITVRAFARGRAVKARVTGPGRVAILDRPFTSGDTP